VTVRDVDHGYAALMKRVLEMQRPQIAVGVHQAEGAASKKIVVRAEGHSDRSITTTATVADIASWAEFGIGQPERSWLRAWFDGYKAKSYAEIFKVMKAVLMGKRGLDQGLNVLGQRFVGLVQVRISRGIDPPNSPVTIALKGSSKPLIDTGQFRTSITYTVRLRAR
jgi:hypothetical protein